MKKWSKKILFAICPAAVLVSPIVLTSCGARGTFDQTIQGNEQIYGFINDRTFSIGLYGTNLLSHYKVQSYLVGTTWIFYHADPITFGNSYTYYALTNLHVASGIDYYINNFLPHASYEYVGLSYQTLDEITSGKEVSVRQIGGESSSSIMIMDQVNPTAAKKTEKYQSLYSQYSTNSGQDSDSNRLYFDETVVKLDFSNNVTKDSTLKARLDRLNEYASNNNGYVTKFLDEPYTKDVSTIYSLGYPLRNSDGQSILRNDEFYHAYAFKLPEVVNNSTGSKSKFTIIEDNNQTYVTPGGYGGNNYDIVTGKNVIYLAGTNLSNKNPIDRVADWGGGSSGSCGIYAEDPTDQSTYYAAGIHWGAIIQKDFWGTKLWHSCFQSFSYNWSGTENFVENFLSYQWKTQTPTDKFIGKCPFLF